MNTSDLTSSPFFFLSQINSFNANVKAKLASFEFVWVELAGVGRGYIGDEKGVIWEMGKGGG